MHAPLPESARVKVAPSLADDLLRAAERLPRYDNREFYATELQSMIYEALREGTSRATLEHPLRSNAVHTITRENTGPNIGYRLPIVHWEFVEDWDGSVSGGPVGGFHLGARAECFEHDVDRAVVQE